MHTHELTCNSSGNTQSQLSQLAKPLWTDPGLKSGISVWANLHLKKNKNRRWGINCWTFSQNPHTWKSDHHHHVRGAGWIKEKDPCHFPYDSRLRDLFLCPIFMPILWELSLLPIFGHGNCSLVGVFYTPDCAVENSVMHRALSPHNLILYLPMIQVCNENN